MPGLGEIFGGFLEGAGKAVQAQGIAEREHAMRMLETDHAEQLREQGMGISHGYQTQENQQQGDIRTGQINLEGNIRERNDKASDDRGHKNRLGEIGAQAAATRGNAEFSHGLDQKDIDKTITLEDGSTVALMKDGTTKALTDPNGKPLKTGGDLSAADMRAIKMYETRHTNVDDTTGAKTIDYDAVDRDLRGSGKAALADRYTGKSPGAGGGGGGGGGGGAKPPQGGGNAKDPYKAASQADIDWFKKNAAPGSVIVVNGKQFTK